ncbi:hypothetical protein SODALDRAFT_327389 [Sodiomyces alkalinus F11]|uniref:Uncharacterized protein n=1 Tax=Sodiomyces alkalinus (strain CBS 110278 / VKM F-3762 / F11) TaxID=1314773 RepID=A0A3N2Q934_SODAK|nr:hypothetical protein SODALDRAFT_327389 [Sodiomyces alkalinus F11]ROT43207.1 hypothetical protein SODALDRAFT_327389 [Sodiomyces alkalinus F11]
MNTVKSFWVGMTSLCIAGGGAYYFAKKTIDADRRAKLDERRRKQEIIRELQDSEGISGPARTDLAGSPSQESGADPAPTRHAPTTEGQRLSEKSKYESTPFISRKGDRFS